MSNALATREVLEMLSEEDIVGRISAGWDADTDFDALPTSLVYITEADVQSAELFQGVEEFEEPLERFPTFKRALRHFQATAPQSRAVRIDTDESYGKFGLDKALSELERRTEDLRDAVEKHASDHHGGEFKLRAWEEVLGALETISDLKQSESGEEALAKLPQVPITVPDFCKDAVKCWRDGDNVLVSVRFSLPDGSPRIATMGRKPKLNTDEIEQWAESQGHDTLTILGVADSVAEVATGKRLLRDTAQAALEAQAHSDVYEMDESGEPVVFIGIEQSNSPLAAVMYLQQKAESGDPQAMAELETMYKAATTPSGKKIAAPMLAEASRRLAVGRGAQRRRRHADYIKIMGFI